VRTTSIRRVPGHRGRRRMRSGAIRQAGGTSARESRLAQLARFGLAITGKPLLEGTPLPEGKPRLELKPEDV